MRRWGRVVQAQVVPRKRWVVVVRPLPTAPIVEINEFSIDENNNWKHSKRILMTYKIIVEDRSSLIIESNDYTREYDKEMWEVEFETRWLYEEV